MDFEGTNGVIMHMGDAKQHRCPVPSPMICHSHAAKAFWTCARRTDRQLLGRVSVSRHDPRGPEPK